MARAGSSSATATSSPSGATRRVDITNSVTKTFLTTVVGLAWQRGLIHDVNDYARDYMPPHVDLFEAEHNRRSSGITCCGRPAIGRGRCGEAGLGGSAGRRKAGGLADPQLWEPGTHFKYNDVRVNVMALAALQVWRRSLPDVLREEVMEPIGASSTWRWYGYENSWVEVDGKKVQSVSGGGHWGGGMFINWYDMARFGYLFLRNGKWRSKQIVSDKWIQMARTPGIRQSNLRLRQLVSEHRPQAASGSAGNRRPLRRQRIEHHLHGFGERHRRVFRWIRNDRELNKVIEKLMASLAPPSTQQQHLAESQKVRGRSGALPFTNGFNTAAINP